MAKKPTKAELSKAGKVLNDPKSTAEQKRKAGEILAQG